MGLLLFFMIFIISILNLVAFNIFKILYDKSKNFENNQKSKYYRLEKLDYFILIPFSVLISYLFSINMSLGHEPKLISNSGLLESLLIIFFCQILFSIKFKTLSNILSSILLIIAILNLGNSNYYIYSFIGNLISSFILLIFLFICSEHSLDVSKKDFYFTAALGLLIPIELVFQFILRTFIFISLFYIFLLILKKAKLIENLSITTTLVISFLTLFFY